ncbi:MAG: hypothetical protein OSJ74_09830, partial [Clostridia bacterium]|nr:hypothetical protein [Clostridia bacterium]
MRSRFLGRGSATKRSYSLTKGKLFRVKFALTKTVSKHARNRTVTGSKISSRTGIYTIGIAHYTYSASLHKFV